MEMIVMTLIVKLKITSGAGADLSDSPLCPVDFIFTSACGGGFGNGVI